MIQEVVIYKKPSKVPFAQNKINQTESLKLPVGEKNFSLNEEFGFDHIIDLLTMSYAAYLAEMLVRHELQLKTSRG